jgi:uncharacterized cupin superfamily protein
METRLLHVSQVPIVSGSPYRGKDAIKPEHFAGKQEARLGKSVGLTQFGVNLVTLKPGAMSALRHWHEGEDEFVYVLEGELTLIDDNGPHKIGEGHFAGFPAGVANGHHVVNESEEPATFIVVGSRRPGNDMVHYPDDALGPIRK